MEFVTDRTKMDVLLGTEKGCYGAADLNRVESAVKELLDLAKLLGIKKDFEVKTDWNFPSEFSASQWPTKMQMTRYLNNVHSLCDAVEVAAAIPTTMENLTWDGANQIEQALQATYERLQKIITNFRYSGEFFAGEEKYL